jgi:hypothetical protein
MKESIENLQYVIGAVVSFAMQGLKKVPVIDANKSWLIPLVMIVVCVGACWGNHVENWLVAGTTMALAICKLYDWATTKKEG